MNKQLYYETTLIFQGTYQSVKIVTTFPPTVESLLEIIETEPDLDVSKKHMAAQLIPLGLPPFEIAVKKHCRSHTFAGVIVGSIIIETHYLFSKGV